VLPASLRPPLEALGVFGERLREMLLFGSYARGEAHEDSDVDVLVVIDGLTDLEIGLVATEATPVALRTGLPLAPLPISTERLAELRRTRRSLAVELERDGVAL
jgi:predicted nucleotidyltransferase